VRFCLHPSKNYQVLYRDGVCSFNAKVKFSPPFVRLSSTLILMTSSFHYQRKGLPNFDLADPLASRYTGLQWSPHIPKLLSLYFGYAHVCAKRAKIFVHFGFIIKLWKFAGGLL